MASARKPRLLVAFLATFLVFAAADECLDEHDGCVNWAKSGECDRNPGVRK